MNKKKLIDLAKKSTQIVEDYNLKFFFEADGYKFNNRNLAQWYQKESGVWTKFVARDFDKIKQALLDKSFDINYNYNLQYLRYIRDQYDHMCISCSGGYDSNTVLQEALDNNIFVDETVSWIWIDKENQCNKEVTVNALPIIQSNRHLIGKHTFVTTSYQDIDEIWDDPYAFFTLSYIGPMPLHMPQIIRPGIDATKKHRHEVNLSKQSAYILAADKPQMIYYNNRWFVACIDSHFSTNLSIPNAVYFWLEPENIKGLIKDALCYREYILSQEKKLRNFEFFKTWNCDNKLNRFVNRKPILDESAQWQKNEKIIQRWQSVIYNDQNYLIKKYSDNLSKFYEIFPETKDGFKEYNSSKFAWFVDIDSFEIYTQEELIPMGFQI